MDALMRNFVLDGCTSSTCGPAMPHVVGGGGRICVRSAILVSFLLTFSMSAEAEGLNDIAEKCESALSSGDPAAMEAVLEAVRPRRDVNEVASRKRVEACLSKGFGEPWEYSFPEREWLSVADAQARLQAKRDAKANEERAKAQSEADRAANASRVAELVYSSCTALFRRDQVAAMTNELCVETFLRVGLPSD